MAKKKQHKVQPVINIPVDDFFSIYKPIVNHIVRANTPDNIGNSEICSWNGCMYETYGHEIQHILRLTNNKKTQKKVWTIIEGENNIDYIVAGFHLVNRMGFIVTEKPWVAGTEEVKVD